MIYLINNNESNIPKEEKMNILYVNNQVNLSQVSENKYEEYDYVIIRNRDDSSKLNDKYKKSNVIMNMKNGELVKVSDAYRALQNLISSGDIITTSTILNISNNLDFFVYRVGDLVERGAKIKAIREEIDIDKKSFWEKWETVIWAQNIFNDARLEERENGKNTDLRFGKKKYSDYERFSELYVEYHLNQIKQYEFAEKLNVSRPILSRMIKEFEKDYVLIGERIFRLDELQKKIK